MSPFIANPFRGRTRELLPHIRPTRRRRHYLGGSASGRYSRALTIEALEDRMLLTSYIVDTFEDDPWADQFDTDERVSLREALTAANKNATFGDAPAGESGTVDTITFADSLIGQTIVLGGAELTVSDDLSITGPVPVNSDPSATELPAPTLTISGDNVSRVFSIAAGVTATISWAIITGGAAESVEGDDPTGGGIHNEGTLTVENCTLTHNFARRADDLGGFGGGIYNIGWLKVTDTDFSQNWSRHCGGAIYNLGTLAVTHGTFSDNTTRVNGGGIANVGGVLTAADSEFKHNSAHTGGGIDNWYGEIDVSHSVFTENETDTGAAIWTDGPANITDSRFEANHARWWGGAINHQVSTMTVSNCTFEGNRASNDWGGAIFTRYSVMRVFSSTFSDNFAGSEGGAIESWVATCEINNCTISGNSSNGIGGGIYNAGKLNITNSTIFGNRADADGDGWGTGGGLWNYPRYELQVLNNTILGGNVVGLPGSDYPQDIDGTVDSTSSHNLIGDAATAGGLVHEVNGNIVGDGGSGTINMTTVLDPQLADNGGPTATHALVANSPAIDAGDDNLAVDTEGNSLLNDQRGPKFARIYGAAVDIGAFETQPMPVEIDIKPGSDQNSINLGSNGVIAVAIFTTDGFDASMVDAATVVFAGAYSVQHALEDVDGDGDLDMVLHFRVKDTNLADIYAQLLTEDSDSSCKEWEVSLAGKTTDDKSFAGVDGVDIFFAGKALRDLLDELALAGLL